MANHFLVRAAHEAVAVGGWAAGVAGGLGDAVTVAATQTHAAPEAR